VQVEAEELSFPRTEVAMAKKKTVRKSPMKRVNRTAAAAGRSQLTAAVIQRLEALTHALEANTKQLAAVEQRLQGLLTSSPEFHLKGSLQPTAAAASLKASVTSALPSTGTKQVQMKFEKQAGSPEEVRIVLDKGTKREVVLQPGDDDGESRARDVDSEVDGVIDVIGEVGETATVKVSHALPDTITLTLDKGPQNKGVFTLRVRP
jgi:hypothetical protein